MTSRFVSRRNALKLGAAGAAVPLVHIRTAGAAGKLSCGFWDHWVPGANDVLRKIVNGWAQKNQVDVSIDFITSVGNKNLLTLAAEAQAKTGHDLQQFPTWEVRNHADDLEPVDDVVKRLVAKYGPMNEIVDYLAKSKGSFKAMPAITGSQYKGCASRIDLFKQHMGMDLPTIFPVADKMGPGYEDWTWDKFLEGAPKFKKAGVPYGLPMGQFTDAVDWVGSCFAAFGAELVSAKGDITVKSDGVRKVLEFFKKLMPDLPGDVFSWDDASNNRALISGKSALIFNPPSAWAVAVRDNPEVGKQVWHHPSPKGEKGRFTPYLPYFWGVWNFASNKPAAKDLIEFLCQREQAEQLVTASHGYDIPPFASMSDFKVWREEGPPTGTVFNYPVRASQGARPWIAAYPAPPEVAVQIYNQATMTKMVARMIQSGDTVDKAIDWAEGELEGFTR